MTATIDIRNYKTGIIMDIIHNQKIVDAVDSQSPDYVRGVNDSLLKCNVFPFLRIPDTQNKADAYILMSVDITGMNAGNATFADMRVTLWVMAHQDRMIMETENATRTDYIGEELRGMLDGSTKYGYGMLECISSAEHILSEKYQYRELIFRTVDMKASANRKAGAFGA